MKKRLLLLWSLVLLAPIARAGESDSDLYYAAEKAFDQDTNYELRLGIGYDFSNPFLNILAFHGAFYWLADKGIAVGLEGTVYSSSLRGSTDTIKGQLNTGGFKLDVIRPQYRVAGAFRATPVSGLVNVLGSRVIKAELSVIARAGVTQYEEIDLGPYVGTGLELELAFTPRMGMFLGVSWDFEKPGRNDWQGRTGFLIGPTYRF